MTDTLGAETQDESPVIRELREKAAKADAAEARLAAIERENAVLRSGIDIETPKGKYFVETYQGDPSDTDAFIARAKEFEVPFKGQPAPQAPVVTSLSETQGSVPLEPTGTAERMALSDSSPADTGLNENPKKIALERAKTMLLGEDQGGQSAQFEVAAGEYINTIARAAQAGDQRVMFVPKAPDQFG